MYIVGLLYFLLLCCMQSLYSHEILIANFKKDWESCYEKIIAQTNVNVFVESGTYLGQTAKKAARCFQEVHTVELNKQFYESSIINLATYSNVTVYYGDTIDHFPKILSDLKHRNKKALFWLDGHYMTSMQEENIADHPESEYTPIMKELSIICTQCPDPIILIDDIRLFGSKLNGIRLKDAGNEAYPLLETIGTFLTRYNFEYFIVGDILIAHKSDKHLTKSALIDACTISRLYDGDNYPIERVIACEQLISQATGSERESLIDIYREYSMPWRTWYNKSPHYNLWYGLLLQYENQHKEAIKQFQEVLKLGMSHWRVYWYLSHSLVALGEVAQAHKIYQKMILA